MVNAMSTVILTHGEVTMREHGGVLMLSPDARRLLLERFNLQQKRGETYDSIAEKCGVTGPAVHAVLNKDQEEWRKCEFGEKLVSAVGARLWEIYELDETQKKWLEMLDLLREHDPEEVDDLTYQVIYRALKSATRFADGTPPRPPRHKKWR